MSYKIVHKLTLKSTRLFIAFMPQNFGCDKTARNVYDTYMTQKVLTGTHTHIAHILADGNMGQNIDSDIWNLRDMVIGSIQAIWCCNDYTDATLELMISNFPDPTTFAAWEKSKLKLSDKLGCASHVWNLGVTGFRFAFVRYIHQSVTMGTLNIYATGKRSGF
jgi:hypothetical protein